MLVVGYDGGEMPRGDEPDFGDKCGAFVKALGKTLKRKGAAVPRCAHHSSRGLGRSPPSVVSVCVAGMAMPVPHIVIVCAGLSVYRTRTFVGVNSTQSLGFISSHFRRRFFRKTAQVAGVWAVGSIAMHRRLGAIHTPRIHTR